MDMKAKIFPMHPSERFKQNQNGILLQKQIQSQVFENYCLSKLFFERRKREPRFLLKEKNGIWIVHV